MGSTGESGHSGAIQSGVASFPLCESGQEIANNRDAVKLQEFLTAGCSATSIPAKGTTASMFELIIANRFPDLLAILFEHPEVRETADIYSKMRPVSPLNRLSLTLNPFEIIIYDRLLSDLEEGHNEGIFKDLYVDTDQLAMLNILLDAATDPKRLSHSTSLAVSRMKKSTYANRESVQKAILAIESRLKILSR